MLITYPKKKTCMSVHLCVEESNQWIGKKDWVDSSWENEKGQRKSKNNIRSGKKGHVIKELIETITSNRIKWRKKKCGQLICWGYIADPKKFVIKAFLLFLQLYMRNWFLVSVYNVLLGNICFLLSCLCLQMASAIFFLPHIF